MRFDGSKWLSVALLGASVFAVALAADDLKSLVRDYRAAPAPASKTAVETFAAAHPKDTSGDLARLALGVVAYEQKDYAGAIAALGGLQTKLPLIADYAAYYLAAARVEAGDVGGVAKDLQPAVAGDERSPLAGKAWLLEGRALQAADAANGATSGEAVRVLRAHYAELPQPDGDLTLAGSYQASNDLKHAADYYQRVYYQYPVGDAAAKASAALLALKDTMGAEFPQPAPRLMLRRADRLLDLRNYPEARAAYQAIIDQTAGQSAGLERDQARVRWGATDYLSGKAAGGCPYLNGLSVPESEADAERLYYVEECASHPAIAVAVKDRAKQEDEVAAALKRLAELYPKSPWRLKALISTANRYLVANRPEDFVPLYKAACEGFPADPGAAAYHWKIVFQAYFHRKAGAAELLRAHLRSYPASATAGAALYFLGRQAEWDKDFAAARIYYERLAKDFPNHYYGMLARGRLLAPEVEHAAATAQTDEDSRFLDSLKFSQPKPIPVESTRATSLRVERSRLLRTAGLVDLADAELRFGARTDGQPALIAMEMASAADAPYLGIKIMKSLTPDYLSLPVTGAPQAFWEFLYPLPYKTELVADALASNLDPYIVAGLIRQESEFNPGAISRANAYGLTQVRPGTGQQFARKAGMQRFQAQALFEPVTNLKLGTMIFRSMLDQHGGHVEQTLAAYNAGPARVAQWVTWNDYREPAEFVESIPFPETRDYVQAVLRNADMYRRLYR